MDPAVPATIYLDTDLTKAHILPIGWAQELEEVTQRHGRRVRHDRASTTSRMGSTGLDYRVLDGVSIRQHLSWLWDLYNTTLLEMVELVSSQRLIPSSRVRSAVNINLHDSTSRYDWHVDSNPVTGLLFGTTLKPDDGGQLVFDNGDGSHQAFEPREGRFLAFDARRTPHTVLPLCRDAIRISVPMNYFLAADGEYRPTDLDSHLYG